MESQSKPENKKLITTAKQKQQPQQLQCKDVVNQPWRTTEKQQNKG
jgi:hypothetical protein